MTDAVQKFKKEYGYNPVGQVIAPGRLELLGNHTDYNQGLVMALAVDRVLQIAFSPRHDGRIELVSTGYPGKEVFSRSRINKNPDCEWANYLKGVLIQLQDRGVYFGGFNAAVHGTIPAGAGLSSSAALEMATALAIRRMYPFVLTDSGSMRLNEAGRPPDFKERILLAKLCRDAENQFVGVQCGLLDPLSSISGRANQAICIDCLHETVEHFPFIGEVAVIIFKSGVTHHLNDGRYNQLRDYCRNAAEKLQVASLRKMDLSTLKKRKGDLFHREYDCALHVVCEIQRVIFGEKALEEGNWEQFGQYMLQSHESSRDLIRNSCRELDILVALARNRKGCYGARLTGGGFGGATINLVEIKHLGDFMDGMAQDYQHAVGFDPDPQIIQIVDGAGDINRMPRILTRQSGIVTNPSDQRWVLDENK